MDLFHYSASGEYTHTSQAQPSPLEPGKYLCVSNATFKHRLGAGQNQVDVFVESLDDWTLLPDFRGQTYWLVDGSKHIVTEYGVTIPDGALASAPAPSLSVVRSDKLAELRLAAQTAIVSGKTSNALGALHTYPTTKDDQAFLTARYSKAVALGASGGPYKFMCADNAGVWARRDHSAEQIIQVALAVEGHITAMLDKLDGLVADLAIAENAEDVAVIHW